MKKKVRLVLACLLLVAATGCGTPENSVVIPDNPEPLPPKGLQGQTLNEGDATDTPPEGARQAQP